MTPEERKTAMARFLHNEGDGGIWEHFDRANAETVADALAPLVEEWIAEAENRGWGRGFRHTHAALQYDIDKARRDGAAAVVARVEAAAGADMTSLDGVRRLYCDPARLAAALASDAEGGDDRG